MKPNTPALRRTGGSEKNVAANDVMDDALRRTGGSEIQPFCAMSSAIALRRTGGSESTPNTKNARPMSSPPHRRLRNHF